MTTDAFEERVAAMHATISLSKTVPPDLATPRADQFAAAASHASSAYNELIPAFAAALEGEMKYAPADGIPPEVLAVMLAAISADDIVACPHLESPTPMMYLLTARAAVCYPCVYTVSPTPPGMFDDTCDFCRRDGVIQFTPMVFTYGPAMIHGEACDSCVERLTLP